MTDSPPPGYNWHNYKFDPDLATWDNGWHINVYVNAAGMMWANRRYGHRRG